MSLVFDIQTLLEDEGYSGPFSRGFLADKPFDLIGIQDYAGLDPDYTHDQDAPESETPGVQITVRKPRDLTDAYDRAEALIYQIARSLHVTNRVINGLTYKSIEMRGTPHSVSPDVNGNPQWVANFLAWREFPNV